MILTLEMIFKYPCVPTLLPSISQEEHQINRSLFSFFITVLILCAMQLLTHYSNNPFSYFEPYLQNRPSVLHCIFVAF